MVGGFAALTLVAEFHAVVRVVQGLTQDLHQTAQPRAQGLVVW